MRLTDVVFKLLCTGAYFAYLPHSMNTKRSPRVQMRNFVRYSIQGEKYDDYSPSTKL